MPAPWPTPNKLIWAVLGANSFAGVGGGLPLPGAPGASTNASGSSPLLDVSGYRELWVEVLLASFTGGVAPSFQPEWDAQDDAAAPNTLPLWTPAAATAATNWLWAAGMGNNGAAPAIAGWTVASLNFPFGPFGRLKWTIAGAPTAVNWTAFVYGK